jgi:hypothetical protein
MSNKTNNTQLIRELVGDSFTQKILSEFGLQDNTSAEQEEMLVMFGENIFQKVMLELLIALPESARDEFQSLFGGGDVGKLRAFLEQHIPELDDFIHNEVTKEYDATKTQLHMVRQGVK